jgi:hypothetical protein
LKTAGCGGERNFFEPFPWADVRSLAIFPVSYPLPQPNEMKLGDKSRKIAKIAENRISFMWPKYGTVVTLLRNLSVDGA